MVKIPRKIFSRPFENELGFGKNVTTSGRLMNPDGSFNVERQSVRFWDNTYFHLMAMPWVTFFAFVALFFVLVNLLFAFLYLMVGIEQLNGIEPGDFRHNLSSAFFFSSQTLTTVGYGHVSPGTFAVSLLASLESFLGILVIALISGLLYGRFSRPVAKIVFSPNMLVAPYQDGQALMFRMSNARKSELIETETQILLAMNQKDEASGNVIRRFYVLPLEVPKISFFSLSWTIVHALNDKSPLWGFSPQDLIDANAEFMIFIKGTDEANQQMVHARYSYTGEDVVWNARFRPVIGRNGKGMPYVVTRQIRAFERV